jgi:hypothetical protein
MNILPFDVIPLILNHIDVWSIVSVIRAIEVDHRYTSLVQWLKLQQFEVQLEWVPQCSEAVTVLDFMDIVDVAKWKLYLNDKQLGLPCLFHPNITAVGFLSISYLELPQQLHSKLTDLTVDTVDQTQFEHITQEFTHLTQLSCGCTSLNIDFSHVSLQNLTLSSGTVNLIRLPDLISLKILATTNKVCLSANVSLAFLSLGDFIHIEYILTLFNHLTNLECLCLTTKASLDIISGLNWQEVMPSLNQITLYKSAAINLNILYVKCNEVNGNLFGDRLIKLEVAKLKINSELPVQFLGEDLVINALDFEDVSPNEELRLDSDLLIAPNLKSLSLRCCLSSFPNVPSTIRKLYLDYSLTSLPDFSAFKCLTFLRLSCDMKSVSINAPNLLSLTFSGTTTEQLWVPDSIQYLQVSLPMLSNLGDIRSTKGERFPSDLSSLIIASIGIDKLENFEFLLKLKKLTIHSAKVKTITNVHFQMPSQLEEFDLGGDLIFNNMRLPDTCKSINLVTHKGEINLKYFKLPSLVENVRIFASSVGIYSQRIFAEDNAFLNLGKLKSLSMVGANIKTTEESPLELPLSLERLEISRNTSNEIYLKFPPGVTKLRSVSLLYNFQEPYDEFPLFAKYSFQSLGHVGQTFHNNLQVITSFVPPINCEDCNRLSWGYFRGTWLELSDKIRDEIFRENAPKRLMEIRILGPKENELSFKNAKYGYLYNVHRNCQTIERMYDPIY